MPYTAPTVNYSATNDGTYTTLTGVQSVNINRGRQHFQDPFPQTSCTIELIPANSYALPLAIGQYIDVRDTNVSISPCYFAGRITDVVRTYDMPYNSGTGSAPGDRITITATGGTGALGGSTLNNYSMSAGLVSDSLTNIFTNQNVTGLVGGTTVQNSAQTLDGSVLDAVNQLLRTAQMFIDDLDVQRGLPTLAVIAYPSGFSAGVSPAYGDTGAGERFKTIEYQSTVQNTFNYVKVVAEGVFTAVTFPGLPPFNALTYSTYNDTANNTSSLSAYLYSLLSGALAPVPFTIATDTTVSAGCMAVAQLGVGASGVYRIGENASIVFRGSSVTGTIQGISSSFYPDYASVRLFFSPSLGTPFTLDSASFGVLDQNRLGFP
jgi:hypothetical protein